MVEPWLRQIAYAGQAKKAPRTPAEAVNEVAEARMPAPLAQGP